MEYKKIMNLLDNTKNQPSNFKTKEWVRISDDSRGTFDTNNQIKFETSMPKSELQDYSDAYIHVKVTITVPNTGAAALDNKSKHEISKNYANSNNDNSNLFKFKEKTGETDNDDSKDVEIIVPLKYLCKFWKTLGMSLIDCEINHILNWSEVIFQSLVQWQINFQHLQKLIKVFMIQL